MFNSIIDHDLKIYTVILFFTLYAFLGWILEVSYRSTREKKLVNAGFMHGPFVIIYGLSANFIIFISPVINQYNFFTQVVFYGLVLTAIEYLTGLVSEKIMKVKLWDYSDNLFNLHGRICLKFSLLWSFMAVVFIKIHPFFYGYIKRIPAEKQMLTAIIMTTYFIADFTFSTINLSSLVVKFKSISLENSDLKKVLNRFNRLLSAYPNLRTILYNKISSGISISTGQILKTVNKKLSEIMDNRIPVEEEYNSIVNDILTNSEFCRLKEIRHHQSSIYDHVVTVSYLAYKISKYLKLDYVSAARGGLLHDFFLYDWRNHHEPDLAKEKYHGIEHPKIALKNAEKNFKINKIEKDIILKHMWPLTLMPPRFKESFVVTYADKYISSKEYIVKMKDGLINKMSK